jgi:hypothetical protein
LQQAYGKGPTLTVISSLNEINAGFTSKSWSSEPQGCVRDEKAWLYSGRYERKSRVKDPDRAVVHHSNSYICFGHQGPMGTECSGGIPHDLEIRDNHLTYSIFTGAYDDFGNGTDTGITCSVCANILVIQVKDL